MRVIAGLYGGRRLIVPPGVETRPTADRVREALFSMLASDLPGARVLDLFAGSGAMGLEALSRGAQEVTFVDTAPGALKAIDANLAALGASAEVLRRDALEFLRTASSAGRQYDLVFLDPPYRLAGSLGPPLAAALPAVLAPGARVIAESDRHTPLDLHPLALDDERRYGKTLIRLHARP